MDALKPYTALIERTARKHALEAIWVRAIVMVESSAQTDAFRYEPAFWLRYCANDPRYRGEIPRRVAASYGLMQVMFPTVQDAGFQGPPEALFVPEIGVEWGCVLLKNLLHWSEGSQEPLRKALAAYNAGRGGWDSPAGQRYAQKVLDWLELIRDPGSEKALRT